MKTNAAKEALTKAINKAIANGAPVYTNIPPKKFRMTRTTVETVDVEAATLADAKAIADAANNGTFQGSPYTRTVKVEELHPAPVYRVVIMPDDHGYEHGDYENEEQRKRVERDIDTHGVEGYSVEMQTTVDGKWEDVEDGSCWGFIGNDTEYMLSQAADCVPVGVQASVFYADAYGKNVTRSSLYPVISGTGK